MFVFGYFVFRTIYAAVLRYNIVISYCGRECTANAIRWHEYAPTIAVLLVFSLHAAVAVEHFIYSYVFCYQYFKLFSVDEREVIDFPIHIPVIVQQCFLLAVYFSTHVSLFWSRRMCLTYILWYIVNRCQIYMTTEALLKGKLMSYVSILSTHLIYWLLL